MRAMLSSTRLCWYNYDAENSEFLDGPPNLPSFLWLATVALCPLRRRSSTGQSLRNAISIFDVNITISEFTNRRGKFSFRPISISTLYAATESATQLRHDDWRHFIYFRMSDKALN